MTGKVSLAWLLATGICLSSCGGTQTSQYRPPPADAPVGLDYPDPNLFNEGEAITPLVPRLSSGTSNNFSVEPALPPGLELNGTTGVISGTPSDARAQATYSVTASNPSGRSQFGVRITVGGRYTVGGVVIGLTGTGLVLANNSENLPLNANGTFVFTRTYPPGFGFVITVAAHPTGQTCSVSDGSGILTNVDYGQAIVTCNNTVSKAARNAVSWSDLAGIHRVEMPFVTCLYPPSPEAVRGHVVDPVSGRVTLLGELIFETEPRAPRPEGCEPRKVRLDSSQQWAYVGIAESGSLQVYSTQIAPAR